MHGDGSGRVSDATFAFHAADGLAMRVAHATVREALSQPYECKLLLISSVAPENPAAIVGKPCAFTMERDSITRRFGGVVQSVEDLGGDGVNYQLQLTVVPAFWTLAQRRDFRVYQGIDAIEVVREVLKAAGLYQGEGERVEHLVAGAYAVREYCVQFGETDFDFVHRLLAEEGVAYYFTNDGAKETLVLVDGGNSAVWPAVQTIDGGDVPFASAHGGAASTESVSTFVPLYELKPTGVLERDYNFTTPRATQDLTRGYPRGTGSRTLYEYPGFFTFGDYSDATHTYRSHDGPHRAQVRFESLTWSEHVCHGASDVSGLQPGATFTLSGNERAELNAKYLVVGVEHHAHAPEERSAGAASVPGARYVNSFTVVPIAVPFRPIQIPRPRAQGPQTARVMPRPGTHDEISVDVHGRVFVEFHWDRPELRPTAQRTRSASCWIRVAQSWAGPHFGSMFVPRVDMEVVVTFLDGDPDRPLITGCVYNGQNMPPLVLPRDADKSILKTRSTPNGQGFNELSFKDTIHEERVFLHAERDFDEVVKNDRTMEVHVDARTHVGRDRSATVDRNDTVVVHGDQQTTIYQNGKVSADESLTLECGSSRVVLYPNKIVITAETIEVHGDATVDIKGGLVKINS